MFTAPCEADQKPLTLDDVVTSPIIAIVFWDPPAKLNSILREQDSVHGSVCKLLPRLLA